MALRNNGTARSARRIAIFALIFDIVSFGFQGGLIFVAIGHDANSNIECTSTNGLCPSFTDANNECSYQVNSCPNMWNQTGTSSCVFSSTFQCAKTITFSPVFPVAPTHYGITLTSSPTLYIDSWVAPLITQPYLGAVESFDTSAMTADVLKSATPFSFTIAVTPGSANEFAVVMVYDGNVNGVAGVSVTSITDTQNSAWHQQVAFTADINAVMGGLSMWTGLLSTTAADTITVNLADSGVTVADYVGGTVELFKNVQYAAAPVTLAGTSASASISVTPKFANDFIAGGAELSTAITFGVSCDSITLSAPTTTRQTDANCAANKQVNFASGDQHPASTSVQTFAATYGAADGDVIAAIDLIPVSTAGQDWLVKTTVTELFGDSLHEISWSPGNGINLVKVNVNFQCSLSDFSSASLTIALYQGTNNVGSVTGTASSLCNGTTQLVVGTGSGGASLNLRASCTSCGGATSIYISNAYLTASISRNQLPIFKVTSITTSSMIVTTYLVALIPSYTVTFNWWAQYP